jgi:hypothetical protein
MIAKTIKKFDPTATANFNMDLDLTQQHQLDSARSDALPIIFTD